MRSMVRHTRVKRFLPIAQSPESGSKSALFDHSRASNFLELQSFAYLSRHLIQLPCISKMTDEDETIGN